MNQIFGSIEKLAQYFVDVGAEPGYKRIHKNPWARARCQSCTKLSRYWRILYSALICRACICKAHKTTIWREAYGRVQSRNKIGDHRAPS